MKISIDEDVCSKYKLTLDDVLCILLHKCNDDVPKLIQSMLDKEYLMKADNRIYPTEHWDDIACKILLESDRTVPKDDDCKKLAEKMRELFPKGIKTGNSAWRGNIREITLRLQKFFKIYGAKWSEDEILEATKKYVQHFNGDYTYMRILKYFIIKSSKIPDEDGVHIEETSELATWLENDITPEEDWLTEVK